MFMRETQGALSLAGMALARHKLMFVHCASRKREKFGRRPGTGGEG